MCLKLVIWCTKRDVRHSSHISCIPVLNSGLPFFLAASSSDFTLGVDFLYYVDTFFCECNEKWYTPCRHTVPQPDNDNEKHQAKSSFVLVMRDIAEGDSCNNIEAGAHGTIIIVLYSYNVHLIGRVLAETYMHRTPDTLSYIRLDEDLRQSETTKRGMVEWVPPSISCFSISYLSWALSLSLYFHLTSCFFF